MKNTDPETWNAIQESRYMNPEPEEPEDYRDSDYYKDLEAEQERKDDSR